MPTFALEKRETVCTSLLHLPIALLNDIAGWAVQLGCGGALSLTCRAFPHANLLHAPAFRIQLDRQRCNQQLTPRVVAALQARTGRLAFTFEQPRAQDSRRALKLLGHILAKLGKCAAVQLCKLSRSAPTRPDHALDCPPGLAQRLLDRFPSLTALTIHGYSVTCNGLASLVSHPQLALQLQQLDLPSTTITLPKEPGPEAAALSNLFQHAKLKQLSFDDWQGGVLPDLQPLAQHLTQLRVGHNYETLSAFISAVGALPQLQPHGSGNMTVQSDEADSDSEDEEEVGSRQAAADMETTFGENEEEEEGNELGSESVQLYAIPPKGRRAALVPANDFQQHVDSTNSAAANPAKETTKLWRYLAGQPITKADISEYIKLAELALVMTPGSVEEERMFLAMAFLKDDTRNRLQDWQRLEVAGIIDCTSAACLPLTSLTQPLVLGNLLAGHPSVSIREVSAAVRNLTQACKVPVRIRVLQLSMPDSSGSDSMSDSSEKSTAFDVPPSASAIWQQRVTLQQLVVVLKELHWIELVTVYAMLEASVEDVVVVAPLCQGCTELVFRQCGLSPSLEFWRQLVQLMPTISRVSYGGPVTGAQLRGPSYGGPVTGALAKMGQKYGPWARWYNISIDITLYRYQLPECCQAINSRFDNPMSPAIFRVRFSVSD
ncbi:hypothetical protein QJQ45_001187 [Haematococcus lacustris]|nr:hypothetical protein QJQ45_001187 [Haematococcus lacustris]